MQHECQCLSYYPYCLVLGVVYYATDLRGHTPGLLSIKDFCFEVAPIVVGFEIAHFSGIVAFVESVGSSELAVQELVTC